MPVKNSGYAAFSSNEPLKPHHYETRDPKPTDVLIEVEFCGICHSDIHYTRSEWFPVQYPIVAGHEFTGTVKAVGDKVTKHKVGDRVAVGVPVDSCRNCDCCRKSNENYCTKMVQVYGSVTEDGEYTQGGYGRFVAADEAYVNHLPDNLPFDKSAPLMCAGITVYSPLKHNNLDKGGKKVGVVGIGGLGHLAVQFAAAFGNEVIAISRDTKKEALALKLGAKRVLPSSSADAMAAEVRTFDYIIDTTACHRDLAPFIELLKVDGVYQIVGAPPTDKPLALPLFNIIMARRTIQGSCVGAPAEAQEMLDFCAKHNILPYCEVTTEDKVNEAYDRVLKGDVMFRFVLDVKRSAPALN